MYIRIHKRFVYLFLLLILLVGAFYNAQYNNLYVELGNSKEHVAELENSLEFNKLMMKEKDKQIEEALKFQEEVTTAKNVINNAQVFKVSSYDLSIQSCGKSKSSRGYGITRTGLDLRGLQWDNARVVAVDNSVIPFGSLLYIKFLSKEYSKYDGVYVAGDSGRAIVNKKIDFFMGDFDSEKPSKEALDFGITKAKVIVLN